MHKPDQPRERLPQILCLLPSNRSNRFSILFGTGDGSWVGEWLSTSPTLPSISSDFRLVFPQGVQITCQITCEEEENERWNLI